MEVVITLAVVIAAVALGLLTLLRARGRRGGVIGTKKDP